MTRRLIFFAATSALLDAALLTACLWPPPMHTTNAATRDHTAYYTSHNLSVGEKDIRFFAGVACIEKEITDYGKGLRAASDFLAHSTIAFVNRTSEHLAPQKDCKTTTIDLFLHFNPATLFFPYIRWLDGCRITYAPVEIKFILSGDPMESYKTQIPPWIQMNNLESRKTIDITCHKHNNTADTIITHFLIINSLMQQLGLL